MTSEESSVSSFFSITRSVSPMSLRLFSVSRSSSEKVWRTASSGFSASLWVSMREMLYRSSASRPSGMRITASLTMPRLVTMIISAVHSATGTSWMWRMRSEPSLGATITEVYWVASANTVAALRITPSTWALRACM